MYYLWMNDIHDSEKDLNNMNFHSRIKMEKIVWKINFVYH